MMKQWLFILCMFHTLWRGKSAKHDTMHARIEICEDCHADMFPEVRDFVNQDLPLFHNVELKRVPKKEPEIALIDSKGDTQEIFPIYILFKEEIYDLLVALGFYAKDEEHSAVPEEYMTGPYIRNQDEIADFYELLDDLIQEEDEEADRIANKN